MGLLRALLWGCSLALAASCARDEGNVELASELRALRLQLRTQSPAAIDHQAVGAAMAPLREVLDGLASSQRELQGKQLALTQEMQRWSQLLVDSTAGSHAEQGKALAARLQQLEAALQQQGERHREVEALLQGALDRTTDRLEAFLKQMEGLKPSAAGGAGRDSQPASTPLPEPVTAPKEAAGPAGGVVSAEPRKAALSPWLWSLLALGATGVSVLCWRAAAGGHRAASSRAAHGAAAEPEPATQDLWEAAALLGEVVGRLRAAATPGQPVATTEPALQDEQVTGGEIDDLFVLDDEPVPFVKAGPIAESVPAAPTRMTPTAPPAPSAAGPRYEMPASVTCRFRPRDLLAASAELLRILAADPRVLRRPEPKLTPLGSTLEVSFVPMPGLPPGERSQLEQRLRDAVA